MINQFLAVSIGIPATVFLLALTTFILFKDLRGELSSLFKDLTGELFTFMKRGIPCPMDYKRLDTPFAGEPVLTQAEPQIQKNARVIG